MLIMSQELRQTITLSDSGLVSQKHVEDKQFIPTGVCKVIGITMSHNTVWHFVIGQYMNKSIHVLKII